MKKLSIILLVIAATAIGLGNTGCGDTATPTPVDTTNNDTTGTEVIVNEFKIGFDTYRLNLEDAKTYGVYNKAAKRTYIYVSGNDASNGDADFILEFEGNAKGTFNNTSPGTALLDLGTGTVGNVRREEFTSDGGTVTIMVTEYGAVGEKIKGTFSGTVMKGVNSVQIKNGQFQVTRVADE